MSTHTPTPWIVKPDSFAGKGRDWRFIMSESARRVVVGVDTYTRTRFGESEDYSGVKISETDAEFICRACNTHADLLNFAQWAVSQFQGESGAGENYWETMPEYRAGQAAIAAAKGQQ